MTSPLVLLPVQTKTVLSGPYSSQSQDSVCTFLFLFFALKWFPFVPSSSMIHLRQLSSSPPPFIAFTACIEICRSPLFALRNRRLSKPLWLNPFSTHSASIFPCGPGPNVWWFVVTPPPFFPALCRLLQRPSTVLDSPFLVMDPSFFFSSPL